MSINEQNIGAPINRKTLRFGGCTLALVAHAALWVQSHRHSYTYVVRRDQIFCYFGLCWLFVLYQTIRWKVMQEVSGRMQKLFFFRMWAL